MKGKRIVVRYSCKVNLGNYENVDVGTEYEVELEDGDDRESAYKHAWETVRAQVRPEVKRIRENLQKKSHR